MIHTVYLGLGSNIGNRKRMIAQAIENINKQVGVVVRQSALYETKPWGFESPNDFINAAICCETELAPRALMRKLQSIEQQMGRVGKTIGEQYQDRVIDIDILLYDDIKVNEPDLKIPHPYMREREFVMIPLKEIFPTV
jgi:2-amino-4-hydroxy-6-hydroxymethyldihydropteridine diphosphokinase